MASKPITSSVVAPIQNKVLASPVTVAQMQATPTISPPVQSSPTTSNFIPVSQTTEAPTQKGGREDVLARLLALTEQQGNKAESQRLLEEETQLKAKEERLNTLNARAVAVDREYELKRRGIMENPEGKLTGALNAELQTLDRKRDEQLADIGIQQAIAQGDVNLANSIIKRKIEAEYEPIKLKIEGLKTYLSLYKEDLTDSEKIILEKSLEAQNQALKNGLTTDAMNQQAQYYAQGIQNGSIDMSQVPQDARGAVLGFMQTNGIVDNKEVQKADKARNTLSQITDVLSSGLGTAVGSGVQRLFGKAFGFVGLGSYEEKKAKVDQLKALLTFENLTQLKGLGAMSDREFETIRASAGALNPNMDEATFIKELQAIQGNLQTALLKSHAVSPDEKAQILTEKMRIENPTASAESIKEAVKKLLPMYMPQSFNSVGGDTDIASLRKAIVAQESQGNYKAINKDSGALGRYQIMPFNLPKLIGMQDTPSNRQLFLNRPDLQDKAFDALMSELKTTYGGDTRKIIAAYYGGRGAASVVGTSAGDRPQGGGKYPSINKYVNQVMSRLT
jgi:hypothetical protein